MLNDGRGRIHLISKYRKKKKSLPADQSEERTVARPLMNGGEGVRLTEGRRGKKAFDWWTREELMHYQ